MIWRTKMKWLISFLTIFLSLDAKADFSDSNWFEPTIMCVAGGVGGYYMSPKGNESAYTAIGCLASAGVTYFINRHYEDKFSKAYQKRLDQAMETIKQFEQLQAIKAANGDEGPYSLRVREVVPAQKLPNGEISSPRIREYLVVPGADIRVGD